MEKTYRYHDVMEDRLPSGGRVRQMPGIPLSRSSCPLDGDLSDLATHPFDIQKKLISLSDSVSLNECHDVPSADWHQWLGRKVCISGVKHGILRFYGKTDFADGVWCGVELDEAVGKNNGTVNGVQYFDAKPNHGIFAPVTKVSKVEDLSSDPRSLGQPRKSFAHAAPYLYEAAKHKQILKQSSSDPSFVQLSASSPFYSNRIDFDLCLEDKRSLTEQREPGGLGKKSESAQGFKCFDTSGNCESLLPCSVSNENVTFGPRFADAAGLKETVLKPSTSKHWQEDSGIFRSLFSASSFDNAKSENSAGMTDRNVRLKQSSSFPPESNSHLNLDKAPVSASKQIELAVDELPMDSFGHDYPGEIFPLATFLINKQEDLEDDQMSLDFDESLGILTPNEMKDFTVCGDPTPASCTDLRTFKFPSSESFDDITDIPDDEQVRDIKVQYISELASAAMKRVTPRDDEGGEKAVMNNTGVFLRSISKLVTDRGSEKSCNAQKDTIKEVQRVNFYAPDSKEDFDKAFLDCESGKGDFKFPEPVVTFGDKSLAPCMEVSGESDSFSESGLNENSVLFTSKGEGRDYPKSLAETETNDQSCDTSGSRDSLLHGQQEHALSKEKVSVSWEDCMERDSEEMMFSRVERPESVYTVGSNDTGYQEDGEFDGEVGMTTSTDSTEISKRFSALSRDSCLPTEDVYRAADSTSTSGYSTGLCDSYCNEDNSKTLEFPFLEESSGSHTMIVEELGDTDKIGHSETVSEFSNITDVDTVRFSDDSPSATHETPADEAKGDVMLVDEKLMETDVAVAEGGQNSEVPMKEVEPPVVHAAECSNTTKDPVVDACQPPAVVISTREFTEDKSSPASEKDRSPVSSSPRSKKSEKTTPEGSPLKTKRAGDLMEKVKVVTKSPKKNVMSKIKAMIEATSCKTLSRNKSESVESSEKKALAVPKRSRWEAVTSKIAASLAEEKTKPKAKREIKSRVDSNLPVVKVTGTCKSPKLDIVKTSEADGCSSSSVSSKGAKDKRRSTMVQRKDQSVPEVHRSRSPRPGGKPCVSSRSVSPAAGSESSTTVSLTSHNSKSKIPIWKGSSSTIASSVPPVQVPVRKRQQQPNLSSTPKTAAVNGRNTAKATFRRNSEQHNGRVLLHHPSPKPIRPPMWLSKAELSQEIQHLGRLCESRTKELNLLKMKLKHASLGFNAFAVLVKYLTDDLDALSHPQLLVQLAEAHEALSVAKNDLGCYEKNLEKLQSQHAKELTELSERLTEVYQSELQELIGKQNEEIKLMREQHEKKMETLQESFRISSSEAQVIHDKTVEEIKQQFLKRKEEEEVFHQSERVLLEKKHLEYQQSLQSEIEQLKLQFTESKRHSRNMEEALHKDTDSKLQWIASKKTDLEKEVDSLKAVLEMRSKEIHSLRKENLEMQKELEDLPVAKERIKMLEARAEDLQALMAEKIRMERQLSTEHQVMKETYEKENRVNKRLSMENEELQWRLKQNVESVSSLNSSTASPVNSSTVSPLNSSTGSTEAPEKSPLPASPRLTPTSRSVFFTFVDPSDVDSSSPQSPKSHYKRVNPPMSSPCRQASPDKSARSSSFTFSNKKIKESCESSPVRSTPRKVSKHVTRKAKTLCQQSLTQEGEIRKANDCQISSVIMENMEVSSTTNETSGYGEKCVERMNGGNAVGLETINQSSVTESARKVSNENLLQMDADSSVVYGEVTDPKKYYHMTFPVLKETGQDCDTDEGNNDLLMDDRSKCYFAPQELESFIANGKTNCHGLGKVNHLADANCDTKDTKISEMVSKTGEECSRTSTKDEATSISSCQSEFICFNTSEPKDPIDMDCKDM